MEGLLCAPGVGRLLEGRLRGRRELRWPLSPPALSGTRGLPVGLLWGLWVVLLSVTGMAIRWWSERRRPLWVLLGRLGARGLSPAGSSTGMGLGNRRLPSGVLGAPWLFRKRLVRRLAQALPRFRSWGR